MQCALCSKRDLHNHIFRRADQNKYEDEQARLSLKVKQIFDDSEQRFGAEKIRTILAQNGIHVSENRVVSIMQEPDLYSIRVGAKKLHKKRQQYAKENLVKREFSASCPNQIWASDITYFKVRGYWVYLCIILDLYSRKIVGWRVLQHMSTHLATTTFKKAFQERGTPNLAFHSNRGSQYISKTFAALFQQCNVKQSFSATARPLDNAVAETFFSTFKREKAYGREYTSKQHFRRSTVAYIQFYNEVRPRQTLQYKTPQAFEYFYNSVLQKSGV